MSALPGSFTTAIVVTTIQPPTECMRVLAACALTHGLAWIVIGDRKGPSDFSLPPAELFSMEQQLTLNFRLARLLPERHYARKNLGYLIAISRGYDCIYETDDDNAPIDAWNVRSLRTEGYRLQPRTSAPWANVYAVYTSGLIWPRGLPLDVARHSLVNDFQIDTRLLHADAPIQQGLANGAPDVDAVWRLILDREVTFRDFPNVLLPRGVWCPFNSQNTWWWREVFPLLYLPSHCSFRMTDIWRSFVAQRCLWELGYELEFHAADVRQLRNEHNLMRDFDQETVGYLRNEHIRETLESRDLEPGVERIGDNMSRCYEALVREEIIPGAEMPLLEAWLEDCAGTADRAHRTPSPTRDAQPDWRPA